MNMIRFFMSRPVFTTAINLLLALAGLFCFFYLNTSHTTPESTSVILKIPYEGASSTLVDSKVTLPAQAFLHSVDNITSITSQSTRGLATLEISFDPRLNKTAFIREMKTHLASLALRLPKEASPPQLLSSAKNPAVWFYVKSNTRSFLDLSQYAHTVLMPSFKRLHGVDQVYLVGPQQESLRIWLDPLKMSSHHVTVSDVENALVQENVDMPAGRLESTTREYTLHVQNPYRTPEDFKKLALKNTHGQMISLGDVARIDEGAAQERRLVRVNGVPAVGVALTFQEKANGASTYQGVKKQLSAMRTTLPQGIFIQEGFDAYDSLNQSQQALYTVLGATAFFLGITALFVWGASFQSLIPLASIPLCLLGACVPLLLLGYGLNTLTLLSLVLGTVLVLSDNILMFETNRRRVKDGTPSLVASYQSAQQGRFTLLTTALCMGLLFVPLALDHTPFWSLLKEGAVALLSAVAVSTFASLTLTPVLNSFAITSPKKLAPFHGVLRLIEAHYERSLAGALRMPRYLLLSLPIFLICLVPLLWFLPAPTLPEENSNFLHINFDGPQGASYDTMLLATQHLEKKLSFLLKNKWAFSIASHIPRNLDSTGDLHEGRIDVWLASPLKRPNTKSLLQEIERETASLVDLKISYGSPQSVNQPLQIFLDGPDYQTLYAWRDILLPALKNSHAFSHITHNAQETTPGFIFYLRREKAASLGVPLGDISRTLETYLASRKIATSYTGLSQAPSIVLQAPYSFRQDLNKLDTFQVRSTTTNALIPLSALVEVVHTAHASSLDRHNGAPTITFWVTPEEGTTPFQSFETFQKTVQSVLPKEAHAWTSSAPKTLSVHTFISGFFYLAAFVAIFMVLAAQFESFVRPWVLMFGAPLGLAGGLACLYATGAHTTPYTQITLLVLLGLGLKQGTNLIVATDHEQERGQSLLKSLFYCAKNQFRPLMMTFFVTFILALLLILMPGAGEITRKSVGVILLAGAFVNLASVLFMMPVLYSILVPSTSAPRAKAHALSSFLRSTQPPHFFEK